MRRMIKKLTLILDGSEEWSYQLQECTFEQIRFRYKRYFILIQATSYRLSRNVWQPEWFVMVREPLQKTGYTNQFLNDSVTTLCLQRTHQLQSSSFWSQDWLAFLQQFWLSLSSCKSSNTITMSAIYPTTVNKQQLLKRHSLVAETRVKVRVLCAIKKY